MGRGVAYAAHEFPYLLNVPAARSSADSRDPLQFLRFAQGRLPNVDGEDFLPRAMYGDYLQDLLLRAEREAPPHVRLIRVFGEVTGIAAGDGAALAAEFADRAPILGDALILALGSPSVPLPPWAQKLNGHAAFRQDPRNLPETLGCGTFGSHRRQRFDDGGCGIGVEPPPRAGAHAAHDFTSRPDTENPERPFKRPPCAAAARRCCHRRTR